VALLVQEEPAAAAVLLGTFGCAFLGEFGATYLGRIRCEPHDWRSRLRALRSSIREVSFMGGGGDPEADRGTKLVLMLGVIAALLSAFAIARYAPGLRAGANVWATLALGSAIALSGVALRTWAIWTLGRFFVREIGIQQGQTIVREGPYRKLRHPSYSGNLLMGFGFGLAFGSWVGAVVCAALTLVAMLPRIRAEEETLRAAFGDAYRGYSRETWRLIPGLW